MEKICENCAHWEQIENEHHKRDFMGKCKSKKFIELEGKPSKTESDILEYWDYEGYYAGFNTGKDFGCIHFKAKSE